MGCGIVSRCCCCCSCSCSTCTASCCTAARGCPGALSIENVFKSFPPPWHMNLRISVTCCATVCRAMHLHQCSRDVTFASTSKRIGSESSLGFHGTTNIRRVSGFHCCSVGVRRNDRIVPVSLGLPTRTSTDRSNFPRTRRQLPTSVPFWLGFETGFDNRSLHQNKRSLQNSPCLVDV